MHAPASLLGGERELRQRRSIAARPILLRRLQTALPTAIAAVLALAYVVASPAGGDLPAQLFRAKLFGAEGFGIWDNWWYGGHDAIGYSLVFPALAWLLTPQLVAAIAAV